MIRFSEMAAQVSAAAEPQRKPAPAPAPEAFESTGLGCAARGCPNAGTISEGTRGGGPWFCFEHFQRPAHQWAEITAAICRDLNQAHLIPGTRGRR